LFFSFRTTTLYIYHYLLAMGKFLLADRRREKNMHHLWKRHKGHIQWMRDNKSNGVEIIVDKASIFFFKETKCGIDQAVGL
jgi:hypothetical protein